MKKGYPEFSVGLLRGKHKVVTLERNQVCTHKLSPPTDQSIHRNPAAAQPAHTSSPGLMDFPVVASVPSASDAQHAQRWGVEGLTLGLYIQRQENQYLSPKDRSKDAGVPKHSQLLRGTAARTGVTQGRHKQGHGLMRIPEACGSEKDKGMASAEGIKSEKKKLWIVSEKGVKGKSNKNSHLSTTAIRKAIS